MGHYSSYYIVEIRTGKEMSHGCKLVFEVKNEKWDGDVSAWRTDLVGDLLSAKSRVEDQDVGYSLRSFDFIQKDVC